MKNKLIKVGTGFILALTLGTSIAYAVNGGDTNVVQRNAANTANITFFLPLPSSSSSGVIGINGSTTQPTMFTFGNRISLNTSTNAINVDVTAQPESNITNLTSDLSTLTSAVAAKFTLPGSGTTVQFLDGTGAFQTSKTLLSQFTNDIGAGSAAWGSITGTLSSQTDLVTALGLKVNTSSLSTVATTGAYTDLTGKPTIPAGQVQTDWNAVTGLGVLLNKPALFSGAFSALTGIPTTLAGYGITDAYPLSGNPSGFISSVPVQTFASLTGKPTTLSGYGITDAYPLSGNPSAFLTSVPAQSFASLTSKPTTLSGYGITDGVSNTTTVNGHALSTNVTVTKSDISLGNVDNTSDVNKPVSTAQAASIATKLTIPTGTTAQVVLGNGTLGTLPVIPNLPSHYVSSVTQVTTGNPTATSLENDFGATTFIWARTGVGIYTVTASSAVFTANKTKIFFGPLNNALGYVSYTVTSTTVITINTTITSILSLVLTTGNSDGLMTAQPIDIQVYP